MAKEKSAGGGTAPPGPFLREYTPDGPPALSAQKASVLFYRNGGHSVVTVSGVRHVDKRALARPYAVCEIAQGTYVSPLRLELPAAGGTSFFKAEVDIEWEVTDPYLAAVQVVTDIAKRLTSPVLERLREVTLTYPVTAAEQANRVITRECAGGRWSDLGSDLGLRVRLYVRLGVDDEAIGYAKQQRAVHADATVTKMRQDGFRHMLQGGDLEQLSFMLAADPEGAKDFLEKIRQEGRQDERDRVDRLYTMALRGELNAVDVETQVLNLLNKDNRGLTGPIGSVPARRPPRELEASGDGPFTPEWVSDEPPTRPRRRPRHADPHPPDAVDREPPHDGPHRSDWASDDDNDWNGAPLNGRTYRSDDDADDDLGWDAPRSRRPRPEPRPMDDPDLDPAPGRTDLPGSHPVDDVDGQPRSRRRARDDGWDWADEER